MECQEKKKKKKMTRKSNIFQKWPLEGEMAALHHSVLRPSHFTDQQDDKHIFKREKQRERRRGEGRNSTNKVPPTSKEDNLSQWCFF